MSSWASHHSGLHANFALFMTYLPYLPIPARKVLLTQVRCQVSTTESSRFLRRTSAAYQRRYPIDTETGTIEPTLLQISYLINDYLDPIGASILSTCIRMVPYQDYSSAEQELQLGINKEIAAAVNVYHPIALDYSPILSRDVTDRRSRMDTTLPLDSDVHLRIHNSLQNAGFLLSKTLLMPRLSKKTPGKVVQRNAKLIEDLDVVKYEDLERIYFRTGIRIGGPTECRTAWKYNDLKPRVYYAQGSSAFHASKFIQAIFNKLVDSLPNTDRFLRFAPETMDQVAGDTVFIYDYSSFTSSLHEIRNFTASLAEFYRHTFISILDTREGVSRISLGSLLDAYNKECNIDPEFDPSEIFAIEELILRHNCGMLGVPGNISSCTLLHGIHLAIVVGSLLRNKVVGDDAIGRFLPGKDNYEETTLHMELENLGLVAVDKMEFWEDKGDDLDDNDGWHYVKRPIYRAGPRMVFGYMVDFPSIANAFYLQDEYHVDPNKNPRTRLKTYASQLLRFWRSVASLPSRKESSLDLAQRLIGGLHRELRISRAGHSDNFPQLFIPPCYFCDDLWECMIDQKFGMVIEIPAEGPIEEICFKKGSLFRCRANPVIRLWEKLGLATSTSVYRKVLAEDAVGDIRRLLDKTMSFRPVLDYFLNEDIPEHLYTCLPTNEPHVPWPSFIQKSHGFSLDDLVGYSSDSDFDS